MLNVHRMVRMPLIEQQKARELVPSGYEFEEDYDIHFNHLEEVIKRHEPSNPSE
jgi:hypothetical protein